MRWREAFLAYFTTGGPEHHFDVALTGHTFRCDNRRVARRIGHDWARTRYVVDRTPAKQPDPPSNEMTVVNETAPAVSI
jgi:hypothetical protein